MTWTVLVWEVTFPVLAVNRWTRVFALALGACFHLGIFASMELGCFVPYTLCIYLAFLPWERWIGSRTQPANAAEPVDEATPITIAAHEQART